MNIEIITLRPTCILSGFTLLHETFLYWCYLCQWTSHDQLQFIHRILKKKKIIVWYDQKRLTKHHLTSTQPGNFNNFGIILLPCISNKTTWLYGYPKVELACKFPSSLPHHSIPPQDPECSYYPKSQAHALLCCAQWFFFFWIHLMQRGISIHRLFEGTNQLVTFFKILST